MAKFCTECGSPLTEGARFCTSCGKPVPGFTAPVEAVAAAAETVKTEAAAAVSEEVSAVQEAVESVPETVAETVENTVSVPEETLTSVENTVKEAVPAESGWFATEELPPVTNAEVPPAATEPAPAANPTPVPPVTEQYVPVTPAAAPAPAPEKPEKKKGHKGLIIGIIAFLVLAGAAVAAYFLFFSKKPVNLNDYVTVTFEKYDGYGEAKIEVDEERFVEETAAKIGTKTISGQQISGEEAAQVLTLLLYSASTAEYDADKGCLSNGDKVRIVWNRETLDDKEAQELFNSLGIKLNCPDFEVTVEGLEPLREYDPFENLKLELSGRTGYGSLYLSQNSNDYYYYLDFEADKTENLSNGDVVTVTCTVRDTDELARRFGWKPASETLTKTYTISTLEDIVTYDVFESVVVTFTGYDGFGDVELSQKNDDYYWAIGFSTSDYPRGTLKNGDKITVICSLYSSLEDLARYSGWQPAGPLEKEFIVEGLEGYEKVDVFEFLNYEYSGTDGDGTLTISWKEDAPEFTRYINFENVKFSGLKNGDKVKIVITGYSRQEKYIIQDYGMLADPLEKEITIEGFSVPLTDASQITPALETMLRTECETWLTETADYGDATLKGFVYKGSYAGYDPSGNYANTLMPVYEITLDLWGTDLVFGLAFEVDDLTLLPDGSPALEEGEGLDPIPMNGDEFKATFNVVNPTDKQTYEYWAYGFDKQYIPTYSDWLSNYLQLDGYTWTYKAP